MKTSNEIASPHVAFSTKSVVLRTPMIEFDEEKFDARPPPLDSCIRTIAIISTAAKTIRIKNNVYIFFCYLYLLFIINFSKKRIWSAK